MRIGALLLVLMLAACAHPQQQTQHPSSLAYATTVPTTVPTTYPTTIPTTVPTTIPTTVPDTPAPGSAALYGCPVFPANDAVFNAPITNASPDPDSAEMMASYSAVAGSSAVLSVSVGAADWFINHAIVSTPTYHLYNSAPSPAGYGQSAD